MILICRNLYELDIKISYVLLAFQIVNQMTVDSLNVLLGKFELAQYIQVKLNKQPKTQEKGTVVAEGGNRKLDLIVYLEVDSRRTPDKH